MDPSRHTASYLSQFFCKDVSVELLSDSYFVWTNQHVKLNGYAPLHHIYFNDNSRDKEVLHSYLYDCSIKDYFWSKLCLPHSTYYSLT